MNYDEIAAQQSILKFLDYYEVKNDQGEILDFKDHAYLWDIYKDFSPYQVVRKAAQIGFSTTANIKALWLAKNKGMDIIYSLPSAADVKDFVSGKTNRLLSNNPILASWTSDKDSIEQKRVGANVIYFKGTWTERAAIATPADLYISDETDRSKQEIVKQFQTRLQHSKYAWQWYFSNPSAPGHGVDEYWNLSDRKHWFVTCECGERQYIRFENIMGEKPYFGCLKCKRELNRRKGEWVKTITTPMQFSGYSIPSFLNPNLSAEWVVARKHTMSAEQFSNFILGEPYISQGAVLLQQMFFQNLVSETNPQDSRPIIGVDTGVGINYVVGNKYGLFYADKVTGYEPIRKLLVQWKDAIAVIDQGGDIIGPRKLKEEFPGRVFLCFFGRDRKNDELIRWNRDDDTVIADRNKMIQLVVDELIENRTPLYGTENDWWDVWTEWKGMYRTREDSDVGAPVYEWHKPSSGRCDYPFAMVYWRIGMDRFMDSKVTFNGAGAEFGSMGVEALPNGRAFVPKVLSPRYS